MNQNKLQRIIQSQPYDLTICILAVASVALAVIDFNRGLTPIERIVDQIIYLAFVVDYFVRLRLSPNMRNFFKSNIVDLIAIFPFGFAVQILQTLRFVKTLRVFDFTRAFRIFRFARLFRAARFARFFHLTKLMRIGSTAGRLVAKIKRFLNTNGLKYILLLSALAIVIASIAMTVLEKMTFPDAIWWSFVTTTTVGYGDIAPQTNPGRIVAILLMLVGIGLIGSLTSSITTFFLTSKEKKEPSSERVDLVYKMYQELSQEEQEMLKGKLTKP